MNLFPMIQPELSGLPEDSLPLYREIAWDYERNIPLFRNGVPIFVTGQEAVLVWAWKTLHTVRFRYEIYTWDYGCELESLIGQPYTADLKRAEAARYLREALEINPYISKVDQIALEFEEGRLKISCRLITVYGEERISYAV